MPSPTAGPPGGAVAGAVAGERGPAGPGDPGRPSPARRVARRVAAPALLFAAALAVSAWVSGGAWRDPAASWTGEIGDPEQFQVFLAWVPHALRHGLDPFVTHAVLYPAGANLMWNTAVFLPALLVAPVTAAFGPTVAYNVLMLAAPPMTALAAYAAFRRWARPAGAAAGGLLFAVCPFFAAHASGHLHLMLLALVPAVLLLLDEIVVRQRWRAAVAGAALGAVAAAQLLTAEEVLALDGLVAALGLLLLAAAHRRELTAARLRHAAASAGWALATFAVLAGYPLYVQFAGPQRVEHTIHQPGWYVNDLVSLVVPPGTAVGGPLGASARADWTGGAAEWTGYLGLPLLAVVAVLVAARWRRPAVWFPAAMAALATVLSFGPRLHVAGHVVGPPLPWAAVDRLPLLHQALPARLGLYAQLFAAALVAVAVDEVLGSRRVRTAFAGGLALGAVALSWLPYGLPVSRVGQPAFFGDGGGVARLPAGGVAVVLPVVEGPNTEHAELWQARAGFRFSMPEGYFIVPGPHEGPHTQTYRAFAEHATAAGNLAAWQARAVLAEWRAWGVQAVLVGPGGDGYDQRGAAREVAQVLGRPPAWEGDVAVFRLPAPP